MAEKLIIETEREDDGRWLAEVIALPGTMSYGRTHDETVARVQALALRVLADRLEHGEAVPDSDEIGAKMMARIARKSGLRPEDL
ncbi:MAG TPA: hypothetical protein VGR35_12410 [Tepidisphaeraceae bacterium]|nr:hypothetical protein [Tepidisphaeraceae bacterium]